MIIDSHVHLTKGERALDELMAAREKAGIDRICVSSCGELFNQPRDDAVRRAFERYPEHIHGMGWIRLGEDGPDKVDRFMGEGFSGLKMITPLMPYDHDDAMPVYERAARYGVPILFHTGVVMRFPLDGTYDTSSARMRPIYLDHIARRFPELPLMAAHLGVPWIDEALAVAAANPNVWVDATGVIRRLIKKPDSYFDSLLFWATLPDKWLFGTDTMPADMPLITELHRQLMDRLDLDAETQAAVMGGRMAALLGIELR